MRALVQLGMNGHFPLFQDFWPKFIELKEKKFQKITGLERARAKKLFQQISKLPLLEHKKIALNSLSEDDKKLFMKAFMRLVEDKILDQKLELH